MTSTTVEEELAEIREHIDRLEARAKSGGAEARAWIQSHLAALRQEEAAVVAATREASAEVEGKVAQLRTRLEVAENSLAADAEQARSSFAAAVEEELQSWDAFFERLQTTAATRAGQAREQAEAAIRDLRSRRLAIAKGLEQLRAISGAAWLEQRKRLSLAREELEHKADELSANLRRR
jgi:hypothetical protein